jgi:hypothetical protein
MENKKWATSRDQTNSQDDWQLAEHNDNKFTGRDATELLTASDAYSADEDQDDEALYSDNDLDEGNEADSEEDAESEDDADELTDWGNVDPQSHPGFPDSNDPSGPGSAV